RIPDTDTARVMRAHVADFRCPTTANLALEREVVLLRVRRVGVERRTGERGEIDGAVRRRAAVVKTALSGCVNKDRGDVRIVRVCCWQARGNVAESSEERRRRNERSRDDRRW